MSKRSATDVDGHIGKRLRELRITRRIPQSDLGKVLGITFQQIQKFERGDNRIAASQLFRLATHLGVSVDYFFRASRAQGASREVAAFTDAETTAALEFATTKKGLNLLRAVAALESNALRDCVIEFIEKLAKKTAAH
jgi:transcriptional regulator with XRE-family HTH domain